MSKDEVLTERHLETDGYIYFASFHESTKELDDTQYGKLMRSINEYAFYGNEPPDDIPGVIKMAFGLIKPQIDANKRKREDYLKSKEDGKKGGAPKGNKNAAKKQPEQPGVVLENNPRLNKKTTPKTTINGNGNGNGNGNVKVNVKENGNGCSKKQPPPLFFEQIKNKIIEMGYHLDDEDLEILIAKTDPEWFKGFTFIDFIADTVQESYAEKTKRERGRIFRKLLLDADNLRLEYPQWKNDQEKEAAEKDIRKKREGATSEKKAKIQEARDLIPKLCECGKPLDETLSCLDCKVSYEFDENIPGYYRRKMSDFKFEYAMKRKNGQGP
jgi:hypothetical protein